MVSPEQRRSFVANSNFLRNFASIMKQTILLLFIYTAITLTAVGQSHTREFRGAWMHTVWQTQYKSRTTEQNKTALCRQLDSLQNMGINAVIFQVRPQADAFYASNLEPWSIYLTDGGKAPAPFWDPLQFMVEECHSRGMELHAWLNPYRVTSNTRQIASLPRKHLYRTEPKRFVKFGGKLYFDPGLPENRHFIVKVVEDIVSRYDIDGIHFDDYFYPYPIKGKVFPDASSFAKYGKGMKRDQWRRHNVDMLIKEVHEKIISIKPWVRFGISPFGIYRNKKSSPEGSDTNGLETYDSLYADVLLWEKEGWIDYLMPQLYWELDHKTASYRVLVDWWNGHAGKNRHLYIGQDVMRCVSKNELEKKMSLARNGANISGVCWWPAYSLFGNARCAKVADIHSEVSPCPTYPWIWNEKPTAVKDLKPVSQREFKWKGSKPQGKPSDVVKYAVYRFNSLQDARKGEEGSIIAITPATAFTAMENGVYTVTAIDRVNNESDMSNPIVIK